LTLLASAAAPEADICGLVLTGGGARSAYQVGVLKGIAELLPRGPGSPFPIITGTSAGAVSAIALASDAAHFRRAVLAIERVWRNFHVEQVFKADTASVLRSGLHWMLALLSGGWLVNPPHSLLDNSPLRELLQAQLRFAGIGRGIAQGHLRAVGICSTNYTDADSVTFYAAAAGIDPWRGAFRKGTPALLTLDHLMASLAIPFLFRPVLLADQYYGDGAMRQTSPLSPAIHLGAGRLLVIGATEMQAPILGAAAAEPTFGQMFGFMLDSLFMDQLNADLERINRYNENAGMRRIESLVFTPTTELSEVARRHAHQLPRSLRVLLRSLGANNASGTQLLSYLLFERAFTRELIELGLQDARERAPQLRAFLKIERRRRSRKSRPAESVTTPPATRGA
jgi:NTE family protein